MGKIAWSSFGAEARIAPVLSSLDLKYSTNGYAATEQGDNHWRKATPTNGIKLSQHKNTWMRKRESGYLICIEYVWEGRVIWKRVEPWVNFPSDILITQLTLLPREVK
jgi:hypothetical protein